MPSQARPPESTSSVVTVLTRSAGVAIGHAGDEQPELHAFGDAGREGQELVAFQHRFFRRAAADRDLEEVIHRPVPGESGFFCPPDRRRDVPADLRVSVRPVESSRMQPNVHALPPESRVPTLFAVILAIESVRLGHRPGDRIEMVSLPGPFLAIVH